MVSGVLGAFQLTDPLPTARSWSCLNAVAGTGWRCSRAQRAQDGGARGHSGHSGHSVGVGGHDVK